MNVVRGISAQGWQELYQRLEKPLYNFAWRYVWNDHEAQDIVHDAFLQLWERRARIVIDTADRYLWVSVLNLSRKRRRWARAKHFLLWEDSAHELASPDSAESEASSREDEHRLREDIERLPESLRAVLLMTEFGEMSYEAVGDLLSIPKGTVGSRRHLAVKRLRESTRISR